MPTLDPLRVSVIIPAREEAAHIEDCVRSVLAQEFGGTLEVLVVDGASDDGTAKLASAAGARVIANPERVIPTALNRGLAAASGDVIIRFDAHAEMPPGYIEASLRALEDAGERALVGGWREARGIGPWGRAAGEAFASRLGIGNARLWRRPPSGLARERVDTVPLGGLPRALLEEIGGWREDLLANEDFELAFRLRSAGGAVVFDPAIWSIYYPRETLRALARQFLSYGRWKAEVLALAPRSLRARQLAPPALVAGCVFAVLPTPLAVPARLGLAGYAATIAGRAALSGGWRLAVVLTTMHLAWGVGLLLAVPGAALRRARGSASGPNESQSTRRTNDASGKHGGPP